MKRIARHNNVEYMWSKNKAAESIKSGETIVFDMYDCFKNVFYTSDKNETNFANPATGPLYIEGAKKGDVIKIFIEDITLGEKGIIESIPHKGLGKLKTVAEEKSYTKVDIKKGFACYNEKIKITLEPMIGVIGVAPDNDEKIDTTLPGDHGGNIDCRKIGINSVLYLPVFAEGAMLSMGDMHGAMGDGETGYSGLETDGEAKVKIDVLDNMHISFPVVKKDGIFMVIASEKTLDEAAEKACTYMLDFLTENIKIDSLSAMHLMTLVGNAVVCQAVNGLKTMRFEMPEEYLKQYGYTLP